MDQINNSLEKKPLSPRYFQSTEMLHISLNETIDSQSLRKTLSNLNLHRQSLSVKGDCEACKSRGNIVEFYMKLREDLQAKLEDANMRNAKLETKLSTELSKNAQLEQKLNDTEMELSKLKANKQKILINHDYQLEDINKENMSLRNEIWQIKNEYNTQINNLKNELLNAQSGVHAKETEYKILNSGLRNNINALEKELNFLQLQMMESAVQLEKYEALNELLKSQVNTLTANNENITQILANKIDNDAIQASNQNHQPEVPQKYEALFEMMQTDLNMNNGQTFATKVLKLFKKDKKSSKPPRLNGSLNKQKKANLITRV